MLIFARRQHSLAVTKPVSIVKTHIGYWISRLYLTDDAAAQLQ